MNKNQKLKATKNGRVVLYAKGWMILFFFCLITGSITAQNLDSVEGDRQALVDLYNSTDGDNWFNNTGWLTGNPSNDWTGVTVDSNGRVVELDMQWVTVNNIDNVSTGNNLTGELPSSIGNLTKLEVLKLKSNKLTGPIPETIGNMISLRWLSLGGQPCNIKIERPWTNSNDHVTCSDTITKRFMETNAFSGDLPASLGNITGLELIEIRRQWLTGTLPPEWGNLVNLKYLFLNDSKGTAPTVLSGPIPEEWGNMQSLIKILLMNGASARDTETPSEALFTGGMPEGWLTGIPNVATIDLRNNEFDGPLPVFAGARDLRTLRYEGNNFTGRFPIEYFQGDNAYFTNFGVARLSLTGEISEDFSPPTYPVSRDNYNSVVVWNFENVGFEGNLPLWIQEASGTIQFRISGNNFTGSFPKTAAEQPNVRLFFISSNEFSGDLPDVNWVSSSLLSVLISNNNFTGAIPESWSSIRDNSRRLNRFEVHSNFLEGTIPAWLTDISTLDWRVFFHDNKFVFADLDPVFDHFRNNGSEFRYAPQKPFGNAQTIQRSEGQSFTIDFSSKSHPDDTYKWFKDNVAITGETSHTLTINSVGAGDAGVYRLEISNPMGSIADSNNKTLGALTSEPIELVVGDSSDEPDSPPSSPQQSSPSDGATGITVNPSISWNSSEDAESYRLQLSFTSNFSAIVDLEDLSDTSARVENLDYETTYFWRVRAVNVAGESNWSDVWSFSTREEPVAAPSVPELVSPANDATDVALDVTFSWDEAADAESYTFQITLSGSSFGSDLTEFNNLTETELSLEDLEPFTSYQWRVRAENGAGESSWSDAWSFGTEEAGPDPDPDDEDEDGNDLGDNRDQQITTIEQNYPNPFNPSTVIQFRLAEQQQVSLKIYNLAGRQVATLVNEPLAAGTHSRVFDAAGLASGIYFYRLITERNVFTKKMTLIK